jgi:hypothetical protein
MSTGGNRLAERRILQALAEGKLTGLAGEGRPLPDHPEAAFIDPGVGMGMRIMSEAGALPPEVELGREVDAARAALARETDPARRKPLMARLAELEMRRAIAQESFRRFLKE